MDSADIRDDLKHVLFTQAQIEERLAQIAAQIDADYAGRELLLVGVLNGAVMVMSDLARAMHSHMQMDWMAVSSYGAATKTSGIVRILKDLSCDIKGRDVLIVEDIIDTGLTLNFLLDNLKAREPASIEIMAMLRKPDALEVDVPVKYVGFDIPTEFVVGYGLDFAQRYRNLRDIATLDPRVYS